VSSRIILENNEGRIGMGFDASEVGRDPDAERLLRSSYSPSLNYEVRKLQKILLRSFGIDRRLASFQGRMVPVNGDVRSVTVPEGGLATTTSMCSLLPLKRHYSSAAVSEPPVQRGVWK
jgi:hypothetical protein